MRTPRAGTTCRAWSILEFANIRPFLSDVKYSLGQLLFEADVTLKQVTSGGSIICSAPVSTAYKKLWQYLGCSFVQICCGAGKVYTSSLRSGCIPALIKINVVLRIEVLFAVRGVLV